MVRTFPLSGSRAVRAPVTTPRTPAPAPTPAPSANRDTFELRPAPGYTRITPTQIPSVPAPADAQLRGVITDALTARFNVPFTTGPGVPDRLAQRLRPLFEASQAANRASLEAAKREPSGAALVALAVTQVRNQFTNAVPESRVFGPALNAATREVLASITPEAIARDGFAKTFTNAVAQIRAAAIEILPAAADKFTPHPLELAIGG